MFRFTSFDSKGFMVCSSISKLNNGFFSFFFLSNMCESKSDRII